MKRDRQLIVDFLCSATGGPVIYRGRDMKTSHEGLRISESDWKVFADHPVATLNKFKVAEADQKALLGVLGPMRAQIVERK